VANAARSRAREAGFPCAIDAHDIDKLLVDQHWRCAVTGVDLVSPQPGTTRDPFGPSLDRIVPAMGYVVGNVRIVCNMVNFAMNEWGEAAFYRMIEAIKSNR